MPPPGLTFVFRYPPLGGGFPFGDRLYRSVCAPLWGRGGRPTSTFAIAVEAHTLDARLRLEGAGSDRKQRCPFGVEETKDEHAKHVRHGTRGRGPNGGRKEPEGRGEPTPNVHDGAQEGRGEPERERRNGRRNEGGKEGERMEGTKLTRVDDARHQAAASRGNVCAASRTRSKKEQAYVHAEGRASERTEERTRVLTREIAFRYETMLVLRPDIMEEEQDQELAKMEAFLTKNGATDFKCMVRGRQRISYPIQGDWFGVYVLCTYKALPTTVRALEEQMSIPVAGNSQKNIVRQMTVKV